MAAVTVFVDDAVLGRFPPVCARTGRATDSICRYERTLGGVNPAALLLVVLGPVGWVALALLAVTARRETLTMRLPYHPDRWRRDRQLRGLQLVLAGVGVGALFVPILLTAGTQHGVWVAVALSAVAAAFALTVAVRVSDVDVSLDASRRWVTLRRVHPDFVAAALAGAGRAHALR